MMALGDKFEAKKGSARLRSALVSAVPDHDYLPGPAHQLLVRLPWADLFTTNWDSLLERAVDDYDRSYDTVITVKQIASTSSPRIVKLHGCARSGTELIFTEESFRTYPLEYAPFVSLVQQSLMETVVVLFGFSGSDPNFKAWHGWVRDHLRKDLPPIFMISLKPADPIDANWMAGRLISQVDLSGKWPHLEDGAKIENFLRGIKQRLSRFRPDMEWPATKEGPQSAPVLRTFSQNWQERLRRYPGWFVAPTRNRDTLSQQLSPEIGVLEIIERIDRDEEHRDAVVIVSNILSIALARPSDRLFFALATALVELFEKQHMGDPRDQPKKNRQQHAKDYDIVTAFIKLCGIYFDQVLGVAAGTGLFFEGQNEVQWVQQAEICLKQPRAADAGNRQEMIASLLPVIKTIERELRLRGQRENAWMLRRVLWLSGADPILRAVPTNGAIIAALERLDLRSASWFIDRWPKQPHDASSNLSLAAYRREIGQIVESYRQISSFVEDLRSLGSERRRGLAESSREAWAFYIYRDLLERNADELRPIIEDRTSNLKIEEIIVELDERLDELEGRRCDPRREIDRLVRELAAADERARFARMTSKTENNEKPLLSSGNTEECLLKTGPAQTFVMMCENVGFPVNHVQKGVRMAVIAARLLALDEPQLALSLVLRSATPEDIPFDEIGPEADSTWDIIFHDHSRAKDDFDFVSEILERLVTPSGFYGYVQILQSRLSIVEHLLCGFIYRNSKRQAEGGAFHANFAARGFDLACRLASSPLIVAYRAWSSHPHSLFFSALSDEEFLNTKSKEILLALLDLSIPIGSDDDLLSAWSDPIQILSKAWYPPVDAPNHSPHYWKKDYSNPRSSLTYLGKKVVSSVRTIRDGKTKQALENHRRQWKSRLPDPNTMPIYNLLLRRRLCLIDAILHKAKPTDQR